MLPFPLYFFCTSFWASKPLPGLVLLILMNSCWTMTPAQTGGTGCPQPVEWAPLASTALHSWHPNLWYTPAWLQHLTGRSCRPHRSAHQQVQYQARPGAASRSGSINLYKTIYIYYSHVLSVLAVVAAVLVDSGWCIDIYIYVCIYIYVYMPWLIFCR